MGKARMGGGLWAVVLLAMGGVGEEVKEQGEGGGERARRGRIDACLYGAGEIGGW